MRRHFDWIVTCFLCLGQTDNRLRTSEVCVFNFSCSRLAITCDKYHARNKPSVLTIVINYRFKLLLMCFLLTCSVVTVFCRVAGPQVADQLLHSLHLQLTVGQLHFISRASFSGG